MGFIVVNVKHDCQTRRERVGLNVVVKGTCFVSIYINSNASRTSDEIQSIETYPFQLRRNVGSKNKRFTLRMSNGMNVKHHDKDAGDIE